VTAWLRLLAGFRYRRYLAAIFDAVSDTSVKPAMA